MSLKGNILCLTALLAAALWSPPAASQGEETAGTTALSRIILYGAQKPAWPNGSIVCTLPGNRVWINSLHSKNARGIHGKRCKPNQARHISVVGPVAAGTRLQVFNNASASTTKPGDSSYAQITFRQAIPRGQTLIIGSFEGSQSNALFSVVSYCNMKKNGRRACPFRSTDYLDDKVSYIRVLPPRTAEYDKFSIDEAGEEANQPAPDRSPDDS